MTTCPCGSVRSLSECCGPIIEGAVASTPEALVRSRYTAFAIGALDHVERTQVPEVGVDFNRPEAERMASECQWHGLHIHSAKESGDTAEVEFVVKVQREQKTINSASRSCFRREGGKWLYVSSKPMQHLAYLRGNKVGRNDPCSCQSGKKFKKCCGAGDMHP